MVPFREQDLAKCKSNIKGVKICPFYQKAEESRCEIDVFLKSNDAKCTYVRMVPQTYVVQVTDNLFHVSTFNRTKFTITCNNFSNAYEVKKSMLIELDPGCHIKYGEVEYYVPSEEYFEKREVYLPELLTEKIHLEEALFDSPVKPRKIEFNNHSTDFYLLNNRTNELFAKVQTPIKTIKAQNDQTGMVIGIMIVWVLACGYLARCCGCCSGCYHK